jgi:hypothetical protein
MFLISNSKTKCRHLKRKVRKEHMKAHTLAHGHKTQTQNKLVNRDAAAARSSPCHVFDKQFQNKMPPSETQSAHGTYESTHF